MFDFSVKPGPFLLINCIIYKNCFINNTSGIFLIFFRFFSFFVFFRFTPELFYQKLLLIISAILFIFLSRTCLKKAFRKLRVPVCGRFCPNEGCVAGYGNRMRARYTAKWSLQIAEMIFQTRSNASESCGKEEKITPSCLHEGVIFPESQSLLFHFFGSCIGSTAPHNQFRLILNMVRA